MMDVDMRSHLLTREEVKAIATMAKDGWAHLPMLHRTGIGLDHDARAQPCSREGLPRIVSLKPAVPEQRVRA